jgi:hypothetical protein
LVEQRDEIWIKFEHAAHLYTTQREAEREAERGAERAGARRRRASQ